MKREDGKVGMKVKIAMTDCKATENGCGIHNQMKSLKGSITTITNLHKGCTVGFSTACGWAWHPDDLTPVWLKPCKTKKVKPVLFDEELLWTE